MSDEIMNVHEEEELNQKTALRAVCKIANANKTIRKGFSQVSKAIINGEAKFVLIAQDCDDNVKSIVLGLSKKFNKPVIMIESRDLLGHIVGFEKIVDGEIVKKSKCGFASISDFVYETEESNFVEELLRNEVSA